MNKYDKLQLALANVSRKVAAEGSLKEKDLITTRRVNAIMVAKKPVSYTTRLGTRIDARRLCVFTTGQKMKRAGFDWPDFNIDEIEQWLYDNWDKILRVLISLVALFVI